MSGASTREPSELIPNDRLRRRGNDVEHGPEKRVDSSVSRHLPDDKPDEDEERCQAQKQPKRDRGRRFERLVARQSPSHAERKTPRRDQCVLP